MSRMVPLGLCLEAFLLTQEGRIQQSSGFAVVKKKKFKSGDLKKLKFARDGIK